MQTAVYIEDTVSIVGKQGNQIHCILTAGYIQLSDNVDK